MNPNLKVSVLMALAVALLFCGLATADEDERIWCTFLGRSDRDLGFDITVDGSGNAYVTGWTGSSDDFPRTVGSYDTSYNGGTGDAFVAKLDPAGTSLVYSTFLGGSALDFGTGIAVDGTGNVYVTGGTDSAETNFPTTVGALDTTHDGYRDAFVAKLDPTGSALIYSTFLGGSGYDLSNGIAVDSAGNAYVTGRASYDFPTTAGAYDPTFNGPNGSCDVFVAKLNSTGSALDYSTFLGGWISDIGNSITLDSDDNAYITGETNSFYNDFPTTPGAFDTTFNGHWDAFVAKLNQTGSVLVYSTYLGGSNYEYGYGIALDGSGNAYVTGQTNSSDFPFTFGAFDTSFNGHWDAFVSKLNQTGSVLVYSTFLGGDDTSDVVSDVGKGIDVDGFGNACVTGGTCSSDFPTTAGAYDTTHNGSMDVFVALLNLTGSTLCYSTFLGGVSSDEGDAIVMDGTGYCHVTGWSKSFGFPTTAGAFDTTHNGYEDVFVAKLWIDSIPPEAIDDLAIQLVESDIYLSWTEPFDNVGVDHYEVYRSTVPGSLGDSLASTPNTFYIDVGAAGDEGVNYFYAVIAVDRTGNKSEESNQVGEFDKSLSNGE